MADAKVAAVPGPADIQFHASGPGGLKIDGQSSDPVNVVETDDGLIKIFVPLGGLDTGIGLRNKHMKEKYLETAKFANAELQVKRADVKLPGGDGEMSGEASGLLVLHGKAQPTKFKYHVKRVGADYTVRGDLRVDIRNHGISIPSYLGVTVKPEVDVEVRFKAKEVPDAAKP
jgi:polyisoprenoid-binding protein YceI